MRRFADILCSIAPLARPAKRAGRTHLKRVPSPRREESTKDPTDSIRFLLPVDPATQASRGCADLLRRGLLQGVEMRLRLGGGLEDMRADTALLQCLAELHAQKATGRIPRYTGTAAEYSVGCGTKTANSTRAILLWRGLLRLARRQSRTIVLVPVALVGRSLTSTYADASAWCAGYRRDAQRRSDLMPVMRAEE